MPFLSLVCLTVFASQNAPWKSFKTPVGITISTPVELGTPEVATDTEPKSTSDTYSPKEWDCYVYVEREDFAKDEDPKDSLATKIGSAVLDEIDLDKDRVTKIAYGVQDGWPTMDVEGKRKDGSVFWYRASRTKNQHFVVGLTGTKLPAREIAKRLLDSYKLPAEVGVGKATKWWPDPRTSKLWEGQIEIWSAIPLKPDDDAPDWSEEGGKSYAFSAAFGFCLYTVYCVDFTNGVPESLNGDDALDEVIKSSMKDDQDKDQVKWGDFKTTSLGDLKFRSATYVDDSNDGRIDILIKESKMYFFSAAGPRGMLDSEDVKKFFSSIMIK